MKKSLLFFFLMLCCWGVQTYAQAQLITGKVTSADDGLPVPGVSVKLKGTAIGVATNAEGAFKINATKGQVLIFSLVGSLTQEVTIGSSTAITVALKSDNKALNEVVITSLNISRDKASLGYSMQTVKGDDVSQTQREDFFGGLQGRVAGLSVNSTNGNPGASSQIVLRGFTSISGDNNALIVVDGVAINNTTLNQTFSLVSQGNNRDQDYSNRAMDINPNDIETYTIMKGPEATALYGSAGAGGAILITTKKGKAGASSVNYSTSFRIEKLNKFPQMQTTYNTGNNGIFDGTSSNFFGPAFLPGTVIHDNFSNFFQTGFSQKHNISFDGGTDKLTYRWSNEYSDTKGTIPTTRYKRFSTRLTGSAVISPLLKVTTSLNYINSLNDKGYKGQNGILMELLRFSPAFDIKQYQDANGNRITHLASIYSEFDNPLWSVNKDPQQDKVDRFIGNVNFNLTPAKWLSVNAIFGADIAATNGFNVYNGQSYRGSGSASAPTGGYILNYQDLSKLYNGSLVASAKTKMGPSFSGTYIVGGTFDDFNSNTTSQSGSKFYDPNFYSINNTLPTTRLAGLNINRYRDVGLFAQAILGYKSLLYLTLTGRVDGTSKLMPSINAATGIKADGDPYFAYPSASLAFNFTELGMVKSALPFLDYGKLRLSYALTGKGPFRQYALGSVYAGANTTGGGYALSVNGGNPDLKPETSRNFETGIEMQFLKNRLGIDFNYYNLESINQIINPRLSYGSGFVLKLLNGGTVRNRGIEVQLNGSPVRGRDFNWDVTLNYTQNRGTVISLAEALPELYDSDSQIVGLLRSAASPGSSTGNVTGVKYDRNKNGQVVISPTSGLPVVSDLTYYPIGDRTPKFTLGIINKFSYKNWNLSFLWDLRYGGDVINQTEFEAYTKGISVKTLDRETPRVFAGVLADGLQNTDHPTVNTIAITPYSNSAYFTNAAPEVFVEHNIRALRLRDATLGYTLPNSFLSRTGVIKSMSVFFTVTDAVLFTNYTGLDPESNSLNAGSGGIGGYGIDYGNIGKPIGFNLGLRVKL